VRVRFANDGGKAYARCEAHLVYEPKGSDATRVTFAWSDDRGERQASHTFAGGAKATWTVPTGKNVQTRWVEFAAVAVR
jgi:catalase (peroxidase I)